MILAHNIDSAFITYLEQKHDNVKFQRIDADVHESLKAEVAEEEKRDIPEECRQSDRNLQKSAE